MHWYLVNTLFVFLFENSLCNSVNKVYKSDEPKTYKMLNTTELGLAFKSTSLQYLIEGYLYDLKIIFIDAILNHSILPRIASYAVGCYYHVLKRTDIISILNYSILLPILEQLHKKVRWKKY